MQTVTRNNDHPAPADAAKADAVLAVLPDRLAGTVTRSTLEHACADPPDSWTPETLGRAAEAAHWPTDAKAGVVIGWVRHQGDQTPPKARSTLKAGKRCDICGHPVASDGSCGCPG